METSLLEKIATELEMIESIYAEDNVVISPATESTTHGADHVECTLNLQPNTGFNMEKIAVVV